LSASEAGAAEKSRREKAYTEVAENTAITEKRKTLNAWIVRTWGAGVLRPTRREKPKSTVRSDCATAKRRIGAARCAGKEMLSEGDGEMFVNEKPGGAAFFPDTGVAELEIEILAVPGFFGEVHGDGHPSDVAVAGDL